MTGSIQLAAMIVSAAIPYSATHTPDEVNAVFSALIVDSREASLQQQSLSGPQEEPPDSIQLYYISNGAVHPLKLHNATLTSPYPYAGPETVRFFNSPPNVNDPVELWPDPVATVTLKPSIKELYLIFLREESTSEDFNVMAVATDTFKENYLCLINLSNRTTAYQLNDEKGTIPAKSIEYIPIPTLPRYQRLRIAHYCEELQTWQLDFSRWLQIRKGTRISTLIMPHPEKSDSGLWVQLIREEYSAQRQRLAIQQKQP